MKKKLMQIIKRIETKKEKKAYLKKIERYQENGLIPWSSGYDEYKEREIEKIIKDETMIQKIIAKDEVTFGYRIDERIVEYPWFFSNIDDDDCLLLDAGSTLNHDYILNHDKLSDKRIFISTYHPEGKNYNDKGISYLYNDLREIPIKDSYFDCITAISTLEHIDMDNSMYGYDINNGSLNQKKSYEYLKVVRELKRVLKNNGLLLITVPYGRYENHGFFQQFDEEMVKRLVSELGDVEYTFFKYIDSGWTIVEQNDCNGCISYNPHTGIGKLEDNAAHSRAICCIKYQKV